MRQNNTDATKMVLDECINRMNILNFSDKIKNNFKNEIVYGSSENEGTPRPIEGNVKAERITEIEEEYNIKIYYVLKNDVGGVGRLEAYLFVEKFDNESDKKQTIKDWKRSREDLGRNQAMAFVNNLTQPLCSEFGLIGIEKRNGGLIRKW